MSRLSAVIPVRNEEENLPELLDLYIGHEDGPDEILLVDDASTDGSWDIMETYARKDSRVKLFRNETNLGVIPSTNKLVDRTTGELIYCGTADDRVYEFFWKAARRVGRNHPEAGMICGLKKQINRSEGTVRTFTTLADAGRTFYDPVSFRERILKKDLLGHLSPPVFRKQAFLDAGGFNEELGYLSDNFTNSAIGLTYGCCVIPETVIDVYTSREDFSNRELQDPDVSTRRVRRFQSLMTSPQYERFFPEDYVKYWCHVRKTHILLRSYLNSFPDRFPYNLFRFTIKTTYRVARHFERFQAGFLNSGFGQSVKWLFYRLVRRCLVEGTGTDS